MVAILGAGGFVGSAVSALLSRRDVRLRLVSRRLPASPPGPAPVERLARDLTDPRQVREAVAGADAVLPLVLYAGRGTWRLTDDEPAAREVNVGVVRGVLAALAEPPARGTRPAPVVVFPGSTSQVGPGPEWIDGSEPDRPVTGYDRQKLAAQRAVEAATAEGVVRGVTLRLPTVFGPARAPEVVDRGVVSAMIRRALAGQPLTVWADGAVRRDLLFVDDVAEAFVLALDHPDALAGRHWVLGSGHGTTLRELFTAVAALVGERTGTPPVPVESVPPPAGASEMDLHSLVVDASAYREVTGWQPRTALPEALRRTLDHLVGGTP
ncbi:NAD-dependent epimerase/dehydratase [Solwaraspora sp. WMMD406]|uniref:NAD-dependent epimerase/dehydratase family protein n=1 Tax=Solwaraspora sp. WMMD406 TaxID=3016095 RepID=UPI00241751E9|nr:NAD-dependent epimerase/dehydratase [Solwaraspora sp. WMMD406]MDG4765610.1 NAD-dependent epimerase/dehydratase [Solwaraspora sp. WMMD406]